MSDSDRLAQSAAQGNIAAFAELVRIHQGKLRAFLRRMARGDWSLADDLAQDTFLEAHRKIGQFRGEGTFASWLAQIGYSRYLMHARKHKLEQLDETLEPALETEAALHAKLDLDAALARIHPAKRAALTLCFAEGYSHEEAAKIMGIPLGTLKSHVLRGSEEVRSILGA
jgi:RNA polymerase sigma factor (sigma-70 family)